MLDYSNEYIDKINKRIAELEADRDHWRNLALKFEAEVSCVIIQLDNLAAERDQLALNQRTEMDKALADDNDRIRAERDQLAASLETARSCLQPLQTLFHATEPFCEQMNEEVLAASCDALNALAQIANLDQMKVANSIMERYKEPLAALEERDRAVAKRCITLSVECWGGVIPDFINAMIKEFGITQEDVNWSVALAYKTCECGITVLSTYPGKCIHRGNGREFGLEE